MDTKLLTYAELATALGIAPASAKRLAIRRGWAKTPGNDGKARVAVPFERLQVESSEASVVSGDETPPVTGDITRDNPSVEETAAVTVATILGRHIERLGSEIQALQARLETVEKERDAERVRAAQVEILSAILELERQHTTELRQERDKWEKLATAPKGLFTWITGVARRA